MSSLIATTWLYFTTGLLVTIGGAALSIAAYILIKAAVQFLRRVHTTAWFFWTVNGLGFLAFVIWVGSVVQS